MAWPWLAIIASNIPWVELGRRLPEILAGSRRLLDKSRKLEHHAPSSNAEAAERQLHDRIATLEAREVEQAKVVEQMAEQLQGLTVSVKVLAARNKLLIYIVVVLAVAMLVMTAFVLTT
jgi:uncharacterized coiled-coil protein SlyX